MHEFEQLEDAVVTALTPLLTALTVRTLEPYSGQLDIDEVEAITRRFPCVYVIAPSLEHTPRNRYGDYAVPVTLIVGDRNLRGVKAAARGDAGSAGVYSLLESIRNNLHNRRIHADWSPFVLRRESQLAWAPELSICLYQAEYETKTVKAG